MKMWRNWNPYVLLVKCKMVQAAALENNLAISQKVKHRITI